MAPIVECTIPSTLCTRDTQTILVHTVVKVCILMRFRDSMPLIRASFLLAVLSPSVAGGGHT